MKFGLAICACLCLQGIGQARRAGEDRVARLSPIPAEEIIHIATSLFDDHDASRNVPGIDVAPQA